MKEIDKKLTPSLEKYLLAVYEITKTNKAARVKDVANYLKIGGPATSDAIKTLASRGYINYVPYGIITINPKGKKQALRKLERRRIISEFLEYVLTVEKDKVALYAEDMEFSMNEAVLEKFVDFLSFMEKCTCKAPKWAKAFEYYSEFGKMNDKCMSCCAKSNNANACCSTGCCIQSRD